MTYLEDSLELTLAQVLPVIQNRIMTETTYFGIKTLKNPIDFWVYQELVYELKPDVIVEIGNYCGGSTLALAHLCDCLNRGRVIGVDISHSNIDPGVRAHPRITLVEGDASESASVVASGIAAGESVMVIEDSAHTYEKTLAILDSYSPLIKPGGYFIVEDSICHHGLEVGPSPGPFEAVETFVGRNRNFVADRSRESFLITWNPKGYLRRIG